MALMIIHFLFLNKICYTIKISSTGKSLKVWVFFYFILL